MKRLLNMLRGGCERSSNHPLFLGPTIAVGTVTCHLLQDLNRCTHFTHLRRGQDERVIGYLQKSLSDHWLTEEKRQRNVIDYTKGIQLAPAYPWGLLSCWQPLWTLHPPSQIHEHHEQTVGKGSSKLHSWWQLKPQAAQSMVFIAL